MFRVKASEKGNVHSRTTITPYVSYYTQPLHNVIIARLYHYVWEKGTGRIWRFLERYQNRDELWYIPFTNRQDIRCYHLRMKNRIITSTINDTPKPIMRNGRKE